MRVETHLVESAGRFPDKTAIVAGDMRVSFAELDRRSSALAAGLAALGVSRGDRVLVFLDNCVEAAIAIYAILKAGAVFSPINASTKAAKLAYVIDNCRASAVITRTRMAPVLAEALREARIQPICVVAGDASPRLPDAIDFAVLAETDALLARETDEDALAMLIYTSGSTGHPKGVMMTHANIDAASRSITTYLNNAPDDIILNVLPLAFDYGLYQLLMAVRIGATLVLEKSFAFPQAVFETMRRERVTGLPLVPTMVAMILDIEGLQPGGFPDLRYVTNTAAALPPAHIAKLQTLLPGVAVYSMYGLTECKRCTWLPPERLSDKVGSVGIAIPGTRAWVVGDDGEQVPPGTTGELVIAGPHVMQGYWENPEATARMLKTDRKSGEKVLFTGDLFRADGDGFLYFVGRKDDIIKTRGEKVAPKEVEAVLSSLDGVSEAIVVGKEDRILGQAICALVVRRDTSLTEREIIAHCARHLEDFMVPRRIEFRDSLPKTDTGKLSRRLAAESLV